MKRSSQRSRSHCSTGNLFFPVLDGNLSLAIGAQPLQLAILVHIRGFTAQGRCRGVCEGHLIRRVARPVTRPTYMHLDSSSSMGARLLLADVDALVTGSNTFRPCPHAHLLQCLGSQSTCKSYHSGPCWRR